MATSATAPALVVTTREQEVLDLLARHLTNAQIADTLCISVRTVESHVSSLLRKLALSDRRSLARVAASRPTPGGPLRLLPAPPTTFIGRRAECRALLDAVAAHRMVTATGPGGVGKTRLVLRVAQEAATRYADGAVFVDLVHVRDPSMVAAAIAEACEVPERHGTSVDAALVASLSRRAVLLVVDNCEHVIDGVRTCLDRILADCPHVGVLATSRARLLTPYEHVYAVPAMSRADAVALFTTRAASSGATWLDGARVATLCRALDGMALAIELAAARCATLGLDGLEAGLDQRLRFLTAGGRVADRHRSLRSAIAWSYDLLDTSDQSLQRTVSVFSSWFDVDAAWEVNGGERGAIADGLGRLADSSLLLVDRGPRTRYRALETIRQFGAEALAEDGELEAVRERHLRWCCHRLDALDPVDGRRADERWCAELDAVLEDVRTAIVFAVEARGRHRVAAELAAALGAALYLRGRPTEAQRRFEEAAAITPDRAQRPPLLRLAASAAASRYVGQEALALLQRAADASDDDADATRDLASMSIYMIRNPGIMAEPPTPEDALVLLEAARRRSDGSDRAEAAVATATAYILPESDPAVGEVAERATARSRAAGDATMASAVLDLLCANSLASNDLAGAVRAIVEREELLEGQPIDTSTGFEHGDFQLMASEVHLAVGDLAAARRYADALAALPFNRGDAHLALARRLKVDAMAGHLDEVAELGERFRLDWVRAGRPVASNLASTSAAVGMVHGLRGDDAEQLRWREITATLSSGAIRRLAIRNTWGPTFDGILALHLGDHDGALAVLAVDVDDADCWNAWHRGLWRPWYAAAWAEAAVLGGRPGVEVGDRIERARSAAIDNPIATALIERAAAIRNGRGDDVAASAQVFEALGCVYQRDRSRQLAALSRPPRPSASR
jgi:predicted ATPase/DNA-binding CsgD family transcriptional regulator